MAFKGQTYSGMHVYLWREKRAERLLPCIYCGGQSQTWAHQGPCSEVRWGRQNGSGDREMSWCPHDEHYERACYSCHAIADRKRRSESRQPEP